MSKNLKMTSAEMFSPSRFRVGMGWVWLWMALSAAILILVAFAMFPLQAEALNQEGGLIETISAAGLFTVGVLALIRFRGFYRLYIGVVCLLLAERELEAEI